MLLWLACLPVAYAVPTADFTADPVCRGEETIFENNSSTLSGIITTYTWDFGDGNSSTVPSPRHTYAAHGTYVVRLWVLDSNGDQDDYTASVVVHPAAAINFSVTAADQCVSTQQSFTDLTSIAGGSTITNFQWNFGDGTIINSATTINPTHDYAAAGTYPVTLTATTNNGCESSFSREVTIFPDPVADFTFPGNVCLGETLTFTNNSSIGSGNVTYSWDFDDGSALSSAINPTHTYAATGTYDVVLTVTSNGEGCTDIVSKQVEVFGQPVAGFTFSDHCFEEAVTFTNTSTGAATYLWAFGDGTTSTNTSPTYTYAAPGTYEVTLEATSANNCVEVISKLINVRPNPVAHFEADDTCLGSAVAFTNLSSITSGSITYSWNFGDGSPLSTDENPSHAYSSAGVFTVELTATSGFSCVDVYSTTVEVFAATVGGTVAGATTLCEDDDNTYTLTLSGQTGNVVRWEKSLTGVDQWTTINSAATALDYSDLQETTWFRALLKNGVCQEEYSSIARVQIDELSVGGTLSGGTTVCSGTNSTTLELAGNTGNIVEWQRSASAGGPWTPIVSTTSSMQFDNLTATTFYRVILQNGVCGSVPSTVAEIEVSPSTVAGLVSGSAEVCYGDNTGQLTLLGNTGGVVRWEASPTGEEPWSPIVHSGTTLDYEDLLATTWYRAIVQSGVCGELITNAVKVQVDATTVAGELSGPAEVCSELNKGTVRLQFHTGAVLRWQQSPDELSWTDIVNTTDKLEFDDLTATTFYRAEVQNGVCNAVFTNPHKVLVNELPTVAFSATEVCGGAATTFTNSSSVLNGSVGSQVWDFADATSSVSLSPKHTYGGYGTYPVKLIVTSKAGCIDSLSQAVVVNPNPVASFSQEDVCLKEAMDFSNLSTLALGAIASNTWDFGNGESSAVQDPAYTYAKDGLFKVTLTVTSDKNCTAEVSKEVTVYPLPVTSFQMKDVCFGNSVTFKNNSTISSGNLTYQWNMGDASQSTLINPEHTYAAAGTYQVNLTSKSSVGCTTELTLPVNIFDQPVAGFNVGNICLDAAAVFVNTTTGSNLTYSWDFGDGSTSAESGPSHRYASAGVYLVTLQVASDKGCTDQVSKKLTVSPLPIVSFVVDDVCNDKAAEFANLSSIVSGSVTYQWELGDGSGSTEVSPAHRYNQAGTYQVTLTGTSDRGCVTVLQKALKIFPLPQPQFTAEAVCDGSPTSFVNGSTILSGSIATHTWNFGDQTNSIERNPLKQYLNPGTYLAHLKTTSDAGCEASVAREVVVYDFPVANFTVDNVCEGFVIEPANLSEIAAGELTFAWDFGNGSTSASANPVHLYDAPGVYTITLAANSGFNCLDIFERQVTVYELPPANAGHDTTVSKGYSVQLVGSGGVSYSWSPIVGLSNSEINAPIATPLQTTDYEVLVTDQYGCQNLDTVRVSVEEDFRLVANNVFTPDENGQNDSWVIRNVETFGDVNVRVFDRFGTLIFQETAYQNDWRGTRGNDILPDGTYFYVITFSASPRTYNGALTIIRNR